MTRLKNVLKDALGRTPIPSAEWHIKRVPGSQLRYSPESGNQGGFRMEGSPFAANATCTKPFFRFPEQVNRNIAPGDVPKACQRKPPDVFLLDTGLSHLLIFLH